MYYNSLARGGGGWCGGTGYLSRQDILMAPLTGACHPGWQAGCQVRVVRGGQASGDCLRTPPPSDPGETWIHVRLLGVKCHMVY